MRSTQEILSKLRDLTTVTNSNRAVISMGIIVYWLLVVLKLKRGHVLEYNPRLYLVHMHTRFINGSRSGGLVSYYLEPGEVDPPLAVQPGVLKSSAYRLLHINDQTMFIITNPSQKQKPVVHVLELNGDRRIAGLLLYTSGKAGQVSNRR